MKKLLLCLLLIVGCGPMGTMLVNPRTGERVRCMAGVNQYGTPVGQNQRIECVQQFEAIGFIDVQNLTPEQREAFVTKRVPIIIEQR